MNTKRMSAFLMLAITPVCAFVMRPTECGAQSSATVTTAVLPAQPSGAAISSVTADTTNGLQWRWTADTGRRDVAQTFTATRDMTLDRVAFEVRSGSAATVSRAPFHLTLARFADTRATSPVETLGNWPGTLPANDNGGLYHAQTWLVFDVPNVRIVNGGVYGFLLQLDSAGPSGYGVVLSVRPSRTYAAGQSLISTDGKTWQPCMDFNFVVLAEDAATPTLPATAGKTLVVDRTGGAEFTTLAAAALAARAGDTIRVNPATGPYREVLFIRTSGTAAAPITFDGGGNVITAFEPLTAWTTQSQETTCKLPLPFPVVLTYRGERLVQDAVTGQFTRYARLNDAKDGLILMPGATTDGWEISTRMFAVQIQDTSYQTYRNVRASGSRNDGFNLHGTGTGLIFENIEGFHNLDEGFSAHDDTHSEVHGAKFWGNDNGVGNVARSDTKFTQVDTWDNLGFGFWLSSCSGNATGVRSWNNGADQVAFRSAIVVVNDVQAFTPVSTSRPWVSYQETRNATARQAYSANLSQITGTVTIMPESAPANPP